MRQSDGKGKATARAKARKAVVLALPFVLTLVLPLALVAATFHLLYRLAACLLVWALWLPRKDVLVVLSEKPDLARLYVSRSCAAGARERAVVLSGRNGRNGVQGLEAREHGTCGAP